MPKPGLHSTATFAKVCNDGYEVKVCNDGYDVKVFELFIIIFAMRGAQALPLSLLMFILF